MHLWVAGWKPIALRVVLDLGEAQGTGVVDQYAEHPAASRQLSNHATRSSIDAGCDESLKFPAIVGEDPQRCVAGTRQLTRLVEDPVENRLEGELAKDGLGGLDQPGKPDVALGNWRSALAVGLQPASG